MSAPGLPCICTCLYNTRKENKEEFSERSEVRQWWDLLCSHIAGEKSPPPFPVVLLLFFAFNRFNILRKTRWMKEPTHPAWREGLRSSPDVRGGVHYVNGGKCKALWDGSKNSNSIITLNMRQTAVPSAARR